MKNKKGRGVFTRTYSKPRKINSCLKNVWRRSQMLTWNGKRLINKEKLELRVRTKKKVKTE